MKTNIVILFFLVSTVSISLAKKPRNFYHHHHHHHHSHGRSSEPTAMISLVDDGDKDSNGYKLQVSGDGQLTSYLKTLENVPDSFYNKPHIITDMDESIIPQGTAIHPRREGAISAIRLETSPDPMTSGQLESSSSNNERYYDQSDDGEEMVPDDGQESYDNPRKQVYYDDDSEGSRYRGQRYQKSNPEYPVPRSIQGYGQREYVIHKDYVEKERIPKEYVVPIEGGEDGSPPRLYGRSRDRETVAGDEYIHVPRDNSQTYVIREREVVVPSTKELLRDYLPVKENPEPYDTDKYEEVSGPKYTTVDKYSPIAMDGNYGAAEKYESTSKYGDKYDTGKNKYATYNMADLLRELNSGSNVQATQENNGEYETYRDAGPSSSYVRAYNVPKNDYLGDGSETEGDGERESEYMSEVSSQPKESVSQSQLAQQQQLHDQIVKQQVKLQQQEQLLQQELARSKQQQEQKSALAQIKEEHRKATEERAKERAAELKADAVAEEKIKEEIKVELLDKKEKKSSVATRKVSNGKNGQKKAKENVDLKTLRSVLGKLIKQVEDIQSATTRIISGNIEPLPVHSVSKTSSRVSAAKVSRSDRKKSKKTSRESQRAKSSSPASGSKQSKVFLSANDLVQMLTGNIGPLPVFGSRGVRPAIPISAMASMATATRVPAPFQFFPSYPMYNPSMSMPAYYPGPWFENKKKK